MASTKRTEVSKTNPMIKRIIAATVGDAWKGRRVIIIEALSNWTHTDYVDDHTQAYYLNLRPIAAGETAHAQRTVRPTYGGPPVVLHMPEGGDCLVILQRFQGKDMGLEIVIPGGDDQRGAIDSQVVAVATDALLAGDKRAAELACAQCGVKAELALALAEARAKLLKKGEAVAGGASPGRGKHAAARLEREIADAMGKR